MGSQYIRFFDTLSNEDVSIVGGKNASLGEMIQSLKKDKINVPDGFATTADAYYAFLEHNNLKEPILDMLTKLKEKKVSLQNAGLSIRHMIMTATMPDELKEDILAGYKKLTEKYKLPNVDVAVRSSATAEDLPGASFAGQQDTYLNIKGDKNLIEACIMCFASLFTDRAITYREEKGFDHMKVALCIGVQKMVRSDKAGAGVIFTIDTESGFPHVITITASWGLGENVVQGNVVPDEYQVFKTLLDKENVSPIIEKSLGSKSLKMVYNDKKNPTKNIKTTLKEKKSFVLSDAEILKLAKWAKLIEEHYQKPMDIEWAKDGRTKDLFIVQARPETVESKKKKGAFVSYTLQEKGKKILSGIAIGEAVASGTVQVIKSVKEIKRFKPGSILVTTMTAPDWVPIMKKAAGIITDHGGRTSHAAIVSRELAVPAIVGTNNGTSVLKDNQKITLSCAEGEEGHVYSGLLEFKQTEINLDQLPQIKTPIFINIASPSSAFHWWQLPVKGIGLARMEFIINNMIKIHPMALVDPDKVKCRKEIKIIETLTENYPTKKDYFIDILSQSIAKIAAAQYPNPVIVRMSDFKTNEYADLIGGTFFEPKEDNPMLGFRGASRYYSPHYREGFSLECQAIKRARNVIGMKNIIIMIPFCRTVEEADKVLAVLKQNKLERHKDDLEVYVMCEIPSNVILADKFADRFDGFSIGSNDLTQLVLGVDRDSSELAPLFDARDEAVKEMIKQVITVAHEKKVKIGICGQAPSDYPDFAQFLVDLKIDSISLNPDSVIETIKYLSKIEK